MIERGEIGFQIPYYIADLEAYVRFGLRDPLKNPGKTNMYDILAMGRKCGIGEAPTLRVLAKQLDIYNRKGLYSREKRNRYLKTIYSVVVNKTSIPFLVGHTTASILQFGVDENIDSTIFLGKKVKYIPTEQELQSRGFELCDAERIMNEPAILSGSVIVSHWNEASGDTVLLGRRVGGAYSECLTIPGGHCKSPSDPVSLRELDEEANLPSGIVGSAKPLGVADQVIFISNRGGIISLARYINLIWEVDASHYLDVDKVCTYGWRMHRGDEIFEGRLTPVAKIAMEMSGFQKFN